MRPRSEASPLGPGVFSFCILLARDARWRGGCSPVLLRVVVSYEGSRVEREDSSVTSSPANPSKERTSVAWSRARILILTVSLTVSSMLVPRWFFGREPNRFFDGELAQQTALADAVAHYVDGELNRGSFSTGSALIDAQWILGTYQMAILGLGQVVLEHPELAERYLPSIRRAARRLIAPETLRFGRRKWHQDPLSDGSLEHGHAYLGYVALALGMVRLVDPETPHAALHDRLVARLTRRLERSPHALIETYPGESYPPDTSSIIGALGLHARATGVDQSARIERLAQRFGEAWIDSESGYLIQKGSFHRGVPLDAPRGSGTALAAYFVAFGSPALSRRLYEALREHGRTSVLGFEGIREYPRGSSGGTDINSGAIIFGTSLVASGLAISAARIHGDRELYLGLSRSAWLFGIPHGTTARRFVVGGPIGNSIMLAMLSAQPETRR